MEKVKRLAAENKVMIFSKSSCCLGYAVTVLLRELGVSPMVYEVDRDSEEEAKEIEKALIRLGCGCNSPAVVPAIFIDEKLVGSTNELMSLHLSGHLNQMLKPYKLVQEN